MASEQARDLRTRGIAAAQAGRKDEARELLRAAIRMEPTHEAAWLWLASVANSRQEKVFCLQKLLEINPQNEKAQQALAALQQPEAAPKIKPIQPIQPINRGAAASQAAAPPAPRSTQEMMAQPPGIPIPHPLRLESAQQGADSAVRAYLAPPYADGVKFVAKSRGRAGERDHLVLRAQLVAGVAAALLVLGGIAAALVLNNPDARALIFAPTFTPTFTPSVTPTSTPGLTPTPSPTPAVTFTPSPTVPADIPQYDVYAPPEPTELYPRPNTRGITDAVAQANTGNLSEAIRLLGAEINAVAQRFDPRPYYYQAIVLADDGQGDRAERLLQDAEGNLNTQNTSEFKPVIDAGFAYVYAVMAEEAFESGNGAQGRDFSSRAEVRAVDAIESDARNATAHLALARVHRLNGDFGAALNVLDNALSQPDLRGNLNLLVERARVYFAQQEYDLALQETFLIHYIDPTVEAAHLINIETAIARDDPGLAVIYTQNYLFYYPGSVLGWKLLGDIRLLEDKPDLAIDAYTQALQAEDPTDATVPALLARAAIYEDQGRWDLARDDYTDAFNLTDDREIQAQRMFAALNAGNYATALSDADDLTGVVDAGRLDLVRARSLIESATPGDQTAYQEASSLLAGVTGLSQRETAIAQEYLARAELELGRPATALRAIDAALAVEQTGTRHHLRGRILEAQGDRAGAIREYEWVLTWSQIYPLPVRADALNRLEALRDG